MAIDDQLWLVEFLKFTRGTDIFADEFYKKAHLGYQRMIYLKWKFSSDMEEVCSHLKVDITIQEKLF
jgi:hypothetical protein